jgi:branched-chain amino acid transport system permease protein
MLGMYATFWIFTFLRLDPYLSIPIILVIFFFLGMLIDRLIIRHTVGAPHVVQIFATVGLSIILSNAALFLWKADYHYLKTSYTEATFYLGPLAISLPRFSAFFIAMILTFLLFYLVKKTYNGKAIRAVAQNRTAAILMGIDVNRVYLFTMGIGTACAGVAGTLLIQIYPVFPSVGFNFVIIAFVVVVLGGLGSLPGALLGGLVVGVTETFGGFYLGADMNQVVYLLIFITILIIRPWGIFGVQGEV